MYGFNYLGLNTKAISRSESLEGRLEEAVKGASRDFDSFKEVEEVLKTDYYTKDEINQLLSTGSIVTPGTPTGGLTIDAAIELFQSKLSSTQLSNIDKAGTAVQPEEGKGLFSGDYNDLINTPSIPSADSIIDALIERDLYQPKGNYLTDQDLAGKQDVLNENQLAVLNTDFSKFALASDLANYAPIGSIPTLNPALQEVVIKNMVEKACAKYVKVNNSYNIRVCGNHIDINEMDLSALVFETSGTGLVSFVRHIISNGEAVGSDVNKVTFIYNKGEEGEKSITCETSDDASTNPSDVAIKLATFIGEITRKANPTQNDLLGKNLNMKVFDDDTEVEYVVTIQAYIRDNMEIIDDDGDID